ncbi:hypothetical protein [Membranihabitans maritimus]|uniref:hypothetical protein n=1 Tax=Membranihabitans maritimus TaxID=2904244 RepID=UPI001F350363|nr:hypothetical protein [Membranihabitans maritimus]
MILVQSLLQQLNGNRFRIILYIVIVGISLQSCVFLEDLFAEKSKKERTGDREEKEDVTVKEMDWEDKTDEDEVVTEYPDESSFEGRSVNILFALPFQDKRADRTTSFYVGFKMAAEQYSGSRDYKVSSFDIDDLSKSTGSMETLIKPENADLIVGPYSSTDVNRVIGYAKNFHIPFVSPWNTSTTIDLYEEYIQLNTGLNAHLEEMAEFARNQFGSERSLILAERKDSRLVDIIKKEEPLIESYFTSSNPRDEIEDITNILESKDIRTVILPNWRSADESYLISLLSALNAARGNRLLSVLALGTWMNNDNVSFDQFDGLNFHFTSSRFLDEVSPKVQRLDEKYFQKYKYFASEEVYYGYDIFYLLTGLIDQYGIDWIQNIENSDCRDCFFKYDMIKGEYEGQPYIFNDHVNIVSFRNFQYSRAN